jgi:2-methylcitrate dehydratase
MKANSDRRVTEQMGDENGNKASGKTVLDRRELIKLGAGAAASVLAGTASLSAQEKERAPASSEASQAAFDTWSQAGWKNDANRAFGNGPIDDTTRQIVTYVNSFSASQLTEPVLQALGRTMVDSVAALVSGFECEPARISARLAKSIQSDLKCTVLGYGITTSPEMATFANGAMLRHTDFNDHGPGWHNSDIIAGILAIGEALHSTGLQVLTAIAVGYELMGAFRSAFRGFGWDAPCEGMATAIGAGKLMGLNEDQLANALAMALVPHMPMEATHVGALSHWKGCHSAEACKCGVWAALLARAGMTGPCQPFEARTGLFDHTGPFKDFHLPAPSPDGRLVIERMGFKRTPSEGSSQATLELIPQIRAWTKVENIASIQHHMPFHPWQEIADPPKWDPRNPETADHSMPYLIARALMDGEIYLDSFKPEKLMDPQVRALMAKIAVHPVAGWSGLGPSRITVRTVGGEEKSWNSLNGERNATPGHFNTPMTTEEIRAKFNRVCDYMQIAGDQRDRAGAQWARLQDVHDIAIPMRTMANFGHPAPL